MDCEKNVKNLQFLAFRAKMANFEQFLAKMGKTGIFSKKRLEHFSRTYALTNCKLQKSNERFSSNSVTYVRTDVRADGRESLGLQRLRRETKNWFN